MRKLEYPSIGETLYRDTLPNGLHLSVAVKPGYTRSFAFFAADYGGADRRYRINGNPVDTPMGVAHYLEHKMFDMPEGDNALSVLAASGAQPNAYTSSCITAYHFESTENFDENLRMLLRFVSTPWFTPKSVAKEQGIIGQEIRMTEDDPDHVVYDELMRSLYRSHPIRDGVIGTIENISRITPETLYHCHNIFYQPGNMALAVVGDVDPEAVSAAAAELLPPHRGDVPRRDYGPEEDALPLRERYLRRMEVSAPQFMLGAKLAPAPAGEALLRQKLLCDVALSCLYGPSSPFYSRLYAQGLLNADFYADVDYAAGTATIMAGGESRDPEAVLAAFTDEARRTAERGFDPEYFSRSCKAGYGARVRGLNSFGGLSAALADADFGGYDLMDSFSMLLSLKQEEVVEFIREHLADPARYALSVVAPLGEAPGDA